MVAPCVAAPMAGRHPLLATTDAPHALTEPSPRAEATRPELVCPAGSLPALKPPAPVPVPVVDDVDVCSWPDAIWAITTRMDPARDTLLIERTPIDYLDFASPVSGLGSKMGLDATSKWPGETQRERERRIAMDAEVANRMDSIYESPGL